MTRKKPADLYDLLDDLKTDIFSTFNAVRIGQIESVQADKQTVTVQLVIRRKTGPESSEKYPLLVDVPFFILQGGTAYIDLPIAPGDFCIVLFNDECIDAWWKSGAITDAPKKRRHSLSDGLALVGINPSSSPRATDGTAARIIAPDGIELNGKTKTFVTHAELNTALQSFISLLNAHVHTSAAPASPTSPPVTPMTLDISSAATTTIKTGG